MLIAVPVLLMLALAGYWQEALPDSFLMIRGGSIRLPGRVRAVFEDTDSAADCCSPTRSAELILPLGVPVKTVTVQMVDRESVLVSGRPFGIKMMTDGLIVVGMIDDTVNGRRVNPGKDAGLRVGDILSAVDGVKLEANEQLGRLVEESQGKRLMLSFERDGKKQKTWLDPVLNSADGIYHIGIWVRDSSAGIGTITFFDPGRGIFGGLGHPVCDVDTGEILLLSSGEAAEATIVSCTRSRSGTPGELRGRFQQDAEFADLSANTASGVFGKIRCDYFPEGEVMPAALSHEVTAGPAEIMTTVEGSQPGTFNVTIEKVFRSGAPGRNMIVHITDRELLERTGGICQGMSGSPIIQDGKLVGAVTHVFVNDPTRGYGIFIENMLNAAA